MCLHRTVLTARSLPPAANRDLLRSALAPLEPHVVGGQGAIYLWARLPPQPGCQDDRAVVEWLVAQAGVCVIPGSACGMPGGCWVLGAGCWAGRGPETGGRGTLLFGLQACGVRFRVMA